MEHNEVNGWFNKEIEFPLPIWCPNKWISSLIRSGVLGRNSKISWKIKIQILSLCNKSFFLQKLLVFHLFKSSYKNLTPNIPSPFSHANGPFSKRLLNTIRFPSILLLAIKHSILRHSALRAFLTPPPKKKTTFPHSFESCSSLSRILHRVPPKL